MKNTMTPNGADLLATLINLLADQESVKITYTLEKAERKETNEKVLGCR